MSPRVNLIACTCLLLAATACKKSPTAGSGITDAPKQDAAGAQLDTPASTAGPQDAGAQDAGTEAEFVIPAAFVKFEDLLLPLVREPRSEARSAKTCKMIEKLRLASLAIQRSMPKGVDTAAWEAASNEMSGAFEGMGATCTDAPPNDSPDLAVIHKSYVRMLELLPH